MLSLIETLRPQSTSHRPKVCHSMTRLVLMKVKIIWSGMKKWACWKTRTKLWHRRNFCTRRFLETCWIKKRFRSMILKTRWPSCKLSTKRSWKTLWLCTNWLSSGPGLKKVLSEGLMEERLKLFKVQTIWINQSFLTRDQPKKPQPIKVHKTSQSKTKFRWRFTRLETR